MPAELLDLEQLDGEIVEGVVALVHPLEHGSGAAIRLDGGPDDDVGGAQCADRLAVARVDRRVDPRRELASLGHRTKAIDSPSSGRDRSHPKNKTPPTGLAGLRASHRPVYARPVSDQETRAKLERHWNTAGARDQEAAHEIYHEDCVVEWPQSGERIRGKADLQALRTAYPAQLEFSVRRILGGGDLWISEYCISYDGNPVHVVSIMEFRDDSSRARPLLC